MLNMKRSYAEYCDYQHDSVEYEKYLWYKEIYNIYDWNKMMDMKDSEKVHRIIKCDVAIIEELSENSLMIYHRNWDWMEISKSDMANLIDEYINCNI